MTFLDQIKTNLPPCILVWWLEDEGKELEDKLYDIEQKFNEKPEYEVWAIAAARLEIHKARQKAEGKITKRS